MFLKRPLWICFCLLLGFGLAWAEPGHSIPFPKISHTQASGLQAGAAIGEMMRTDCQSRFMWSGGAEYSYASWISGRVAGRLFGGNIDEGHAMTYRRFYLHTRFLFQPHARLACFIGPSLGLDNSNIWEIRDEFRNSGNDEDTVSLDSCNQCAEALGGNGLGVGYESGLGLMLHPLWGLTAGHSAEITLSQTVRMSFQAGLAFQIGQVWEKLIRNQVTSWIHIEISKAFTLHSGGSENYLQVGISVGL